MNLDALLERLQACGWAKAIKDVPRELLTQEKLANFLRSIEEEKAGRLVLQSKPSIFVVEPTNRCNLRCALCPTGQTDASVAKGDMPLAVFKRVVDQAAESAIVMNLLNWGEPTLHSELPEMIRYAADRGIWTVVSTNFSRRYPPGYLEALLTSGLGVLHIDLDGPDPETYRVYRRGGDFGLVVENARNVVALKRKLGLQYPLIESAMMVMRHNERFTGEFESLCRDIGFDRFFLGKLQIDPASGRDWLPSDPGASYANYFQDDQPQSCMRLYAFMVVNWSGNVAPCCLTYDAAADFGNIASGSLWDVWNNELFQSARAVFHPDGVGRPGTICRLCHNRLGSAQVPHYKSSFALALPATNLQQKGGA